MLLESTEHTKNISLSIGHNVDVSVVSLGFVVSDWLARTYRALPTTLGFSVGKFRPVRLP